MLAYTDRAVQVEVARRDGSTYRVWRGVTGDDVNKRPELPNNVSKSVYQDMLMEVGHTSWRTTTRDYIPRHDTTRHDTVMVLRVRPTTY